MALLFLGCTESSSTVKSPEKEVVTTPTNFPYNFGKKPQGGKEIYIPKELIDNDFANKNSKWCYERSASSENIIVFWETGFGSNPANAKIAKLRVNLEDLLTNAEKMYASYRDDLKFVKKGESNTDKYRMIIMLFYQEEWMAAGAGYVLNAGNTIDGFFERLSNLAFNNVGISSGIGGTYTHIRWVNGRVISNP